jgi:hypothetical protein
MIIALYIAAAVIMAVGSLYFAWRNRDFRKFLAGAFFVSSGILVRGTGSISLSLASLLFGKLRTLQLVHAAAPRFASHSSFLGAKRSSPFAFVFEAPRKRVE